MMMIRMSSFVQDRGTLNLFSELDEASLLQSFSVQTWTVLFPSLSLLLTGLLV